ATSGPWQLLELDIANLHDTVRQRALPVRVLLPATGKTHPVVVFSHGAGGSRLAHLAQARHLASHGYAVLAVEHPGSNRDDLSLLRPRASLARMTQDAGEVLGRPGDIRFVLDRAAEWHLNHPQLQNRLDLGAVAVVGHSFGAYTALAACGARPALDGLQPPQGRGLSPSLADHRITACVALSPQAPGAPFFLPGSFATLARPVLGISGSADRQQGEVAPAARREAFALWPAGAHRFVWLAHADHGAFADSGGASRQLPSRTRRDAQPLVRATTLLFLEWQLRGERAADALLDEASLRPLLRGKVDAVEVLRR
ncbi:MAG: alpha/beta hydrolase family protein, partial [Moraxellaceae bacterium]